MNTNKTIYRTGFKCLAFFLCVCFALAGLLCAAFAIYLAEDGYYAGERRTYAESTFFRQSIWGYENAASNLYLYGTLYEGDDYSTDYYERLLDPANTNYRYAVYNEAGERVAGTAGDLGPLEDARWRASSMRVSREGYPDYEILSTLDPAMAASDGFAVQSRLFTALLSMRYWIVVLGALALLIALALFICLICAAGRYADAEGPECRNLDRMPFDLYIALCVGVVVALFYVATAFSSHAGAGVLLELVLALCGLVAALVLSIALTMSFSARVKCRCLISNTIVARCLGLLWRFVKWCCRGVRALFVDLPILWKTLIVAGAFLVLEAVSIYLGGVLLVVLNLAALAFICAVALQMKKLQAGAKALSEGDFGYRIETKGLFSEFKKHAEYLGGVGAGMGRAVEARMKSERMKTDLITNVSHDLKTPLTSIINYTDLLKKEKLDPPADEYVAVLERQALRLKKLSEDVVEASKASSGALNVNLQPTDVCELINQSMGEYGPRLAESGLTPVVSLPETPLVVLADGRLLWRALDNLLGNAAKYALPGTRVYIAAAAEDGSARVSIKNVSREPLNIDPAELTERFVRGDSSRSAEGSGLGLSIAQSLLALQNGSLGLSIDGDLFKAEITLPPAAAQ